MKKPLAMRLKEVAADINIHTGEGQLELTGDAGDSVTVEADTAALRSVANLIDRVLLSVDYHDAVQDRGPEPTPDPPHLSYPHAIGVTTFAQGAIALEIRATQEPTRVLVMSREFAATLLAGLSQAMKGVSQ